MNLLRISVLVAGLLIARAQAKDEAPVPLPPPDDSLQTLCTPRCQVICATAPNPVWCCLHCSS